MKYHVYTHLCATRLYLSFVLQNTYFPQNIFTIFYNKNSAIKVVKCLETLLCCVDYHGRKTRKFVYGDGSFFEKDLSDFLPMISKHTLAKSNDFCNHCLRFHWLHISGVYSSFLSSLYVSNSVSSLSVLNSSAFIWTMNFLRKIKAFIARFSSSLIPYLLA